MPNAALAVTAAIPTAAAFAKAGVRAHASAGCALVFLQNDTPAHARAFADTAEMRRRQIN
ncbi:hypothetical protein [Shinella zoogloeoides]|uniref:hypothetical protein n=1 Tax=Shinella zoogloeoides TaxID=352475 RepID=UPI00299D4254|nr:hypothetical protein [Shinella zoogloeoides]WPE19682.1 hypothetical protein ShzoTeo12_08530 [Shinella zoogloeoides]